MSADRSERPVRAAQSSPARPRRWALWTAGTVSLVLLTTSGAGWAVINGVSGSIARVNVFGGLTKRPASDAADGALNILVVGTDERAGVPRPELQALHAGGEACHCTDTMMLVHLSTADSRASVVSIPRDSFVDIPAHRDSATGRQVPESMGRINAAFGMGGPPLTVETVEQATGLHIDHYLQLNFLSFISTVDALGGVPVCSDRPLHDPRSGLDLPAGTTRLDGAEALMYVRARYVDPTADLGRMQRQQKFVAQVIQQATASGTLLDPVRLQRVMSTVLRSVTADEGLGSRDLIALATRLKDLRASSASFATVPLSDIDHRVPGWGSTVLWDGPRTAALFDALREDRPLTAPAPTAAASAAAAVPPGQVRVQVLNAAGVPGLGARGERRLRAAGFATSGLPANAPGPDDATRTVIHYDPRWDVSVRTLAAALPDAQLLAVPGLGRTMEVLFGKDFRGVGRAGSVPSPAPTPSAAPSIEARRGDSVVC